MIKKSDLKSFIEGNNTHVYRFLGAHEMDYKGTKGVDFAIWAPEALRVSVVGEFNNWDGRIHQLEAIDSTGVFELFVPGVKASSLYKFEIRLKGGKVVLITDPFQRWLKVRVNRHHLYVMIILNGLMKNGLATERAAISTKKLLCQYIHILCLMRM